MAKKPGKYYISAADKSPLVDVRAGRGDHVKFYSKGPLPDDMRNPIVCPYNLKGNGTEGYIRKWLLRVGVILIIAYSLINWCIVDNSSQGAPRKREVSG